MAVAKKSAIYFRIEPMSGRDQLRELCEDIPDTPAARAAWVRRLVHACEVADAPNWVRCACEAGADCGTLAMHGVWAVRMWLRSWAREDWVGLLDWVGVRPTLQPGELERPICLPDDVDLDAALQFNRKMPAQNEVRPDLPPEGWWDDQRVRAGACREVVGMWDSEDGTHATELGCKVRSCPRCAKAAQWRAVSRYLGAFAAPLRSGAYRIEMTTLTSTEPVFTPTEFRRWRKGIGRVVKAMTQGRQSMGIPEASWAGGLVVVETVPRPDGEQYAHAHLLIIARRWYSYGRALRKANGGGLLDMWETQHPIADAYTPTGRLRKEVCMVAGKILNRKRAALGKRDRWAAGDRKGDEAGRWGRLVKGKLMDPRALFGVRELLRRNGLGEVFDVQRVRQEKNAQGIVLNYLSKVATYVGKVETTRGDTEEESSPEFWENEQIQWVLKGLRRCQPFGGLMKWHAGPTKAGAELEPGRDHARRFAGVMELEEFRELVAEQHGRVTPAPLPEDRGWFDDLPVGDNLDTLPGARAPRSEAERRALDLPWFEPDPARRYQLHRISMKRLRQWGAWAHLGDFLPWLKLRARPRFAPFRELATEWRVRVIGEVRIRRARRRVVAESVESRASYQPPLLPGLAGTWTTHRGRVSRGGTNQPDSRARDPAIVQDGRGRGRGARTPDLLIWNEVTPLGSPVDTGVSSEAIRQDPADGGT